MRLIPLLLCFALAGCSSVGFYANPAPSSDGPVYDTSQWTRQVHLDLTVDQLLRRVETAASQLGWTKSYQNGYTLVYNVPVYDVTDRVTITFERPDKGALARIESEIGGLNDRTDVRTLVRRISEGTRYAGETTRRG